MIFGSEAHFPRQTVIGHSVLAGHLAATAARVAASQGPILILRDTTEFICGRAQPGKIGFTKTMNGGRYKAGQPNVLTLCGVLMHSSLAVTLTGTPPRSDGGEVLDTNEIQGNARAQAAHQTQARTTELPLAGEPAPVHRARWRAACMWVTGRATRANSIAPRRTLVPAS
ncbi:hypothetical protein [Mesorhizobium sp. M0041]|uniref:hypothetical protein n=1 Tax=Mesorhizobium sp. M0041 TaxID=2956856 RepID=UPI003339FA37